MTSLITKVCLTKLEIKRFETRKLEKARNKKTSELQISENYFNHLSRQILNLCNIPDHIFFINLIKNNVSKFEQKSDLRRSNKLKNLIFDLETDYNTITIHNRTNVTIPPNIIKVLELGQNRGIGSPFKDPTNILEIDKLVTTFQKEARKDNISELTLARMKAHAQLASLDVHDCTIFDQEIQDFRKFINNHKDQIFVSVDKSPDIMFINKIDYFKKVDNFLGDNFEKIEIYDNKNLEKDIESYKNIIKNTFQNSLPKEIIKTMYPPSSISEFFGMVKCHKINEPIRGICTGYNSLVSNSEKFLKTLLQPLVDECEFSINNQIEFKNQFLEDKDNFNPKIHRVISVDIEQMYSNVNVPRTISYMYVLHTR